MSTIGGEGVLSNPYARLGLAPGASLADVKRAYRRLAMHLHPDHAGNSSVQTFLAVKNAYEWIVAHSSLSQTGDGRPGSVARPAATRPIRRAPPAAARAATPPPAARSSWPGGRWYWEGIRERAARRGRTREAHPHGRDTSDRVEVTMSPGERVIPNVSQRLAGLNVTGRQGRAPRSTGGGPTIHPERCTARPRPTS
jgi:DnaJ domain